MAKTKKSKKVSDKHYMVITESNKKTRVTIATPSTKQINSLGVISVPRYREVAHSELLVDEVIIKNIVQRRTSKALWEKIVKELRKHVFLAGQDRATHTIVAKPLG